MAVIIILHDIHVVGRSKNVFVDINSLCYSKCLVIQLELTSLSPVASPQQSTVPPLCSIYISDLLADTLFYTLNASSIGKVL